MIRATAESLRRRGVSGTSFSEVLRESRAARGGIYHHFPGGKDELAQAAVQWTGRTVADRLAALRPEETTPDGVVQAFLAAIRPAVADSAGGASCAVAAAATEGEPGSALQSAARGALRSWRTALSDQLAAAGMEPVTADGLAATLIAVLEGAHVLCRAEGSLEPYDAAVGLLLAWMRHAHDQPPAERP
ncbi:MULTISPECIES: TetR/AcrR family transcriptional regulator [unclassified Streptomyces]|uniref:TetR/AcrR family transcriptional regulator n=1 Tax=unclassified Streptomyces TaxID=2593676 RepID=UPI0035DBC67F